MKSTDILTTDLELLFEETLQIGELPHLSYAEVVCDLFFDRFQGGEIVISAAEGGSDVLVSPCQDGMTDLTYQEPAFHEIDGIQKGIGHEKLLCGKNDRLMSGVKRTGSQQEIL